MTFYLLSDWRDRAERTEADLAAERVARAQAETREHVVEQALRAAKAALATQRAARAQPVDLLRQVRERVLMLWGDPEDCDDCGDLKDRPCALHGPRSEPLYRTVCAVEDALGPCACGHHRTDHFEDDERSCKKCLGSRCRSFRLPPLPPPAGQEK